jgi:iron complex transport system permease protein
MIFSIGEISPILMILSGLPLLVLIGWIFSVTMRGQNPLDKLVLTGLTFNLLIGALFSLWQFLFVAFNLPFPVELWFGHFKFADATTFFILLGFELIFFWGQTFYRRDLILMTLGSQVTLNLKFNQDKINFIIYSGTAAGTFLVISLFGGFSFLGLIFPIVARTMWFKKMDLKGELLAGSLCNGLFLMSVDLLCYFFPILGAEIPVGLIATAVGAASLVVILWKSHMEKRSK